MVEMSHKVRKITEKEYEDIENFMHSMSQEYINARKKFGPFENGHEGYAVTLEELEEVWEEVKNPTSYTHLREECVQLAAMAMAMALELK